MTPKQLNIQSANTLIAKENDDSVVVEMWSKYNQENNIGEWSMFGDCTEFDTLHFYYRIKPKEESEVIPSNNLFQSNHCLGCGADFDVIGDYCRCKKKEEIEVKLGETQIDALSQKPLGNIKQAPLSDDELKILSEEINDIDIPKKDVFDEELKKDFTNKKAMKGILENTNFIPLDTPKDKCPKCDGTGSSSGLVPCSECDGWIEHTGNTCPVDCETVIKVKHKNGAESLGLSKASMFSWGISTNSITHYRLHHEVKCSICETAENVSSLGLCEDCEKKEIESYKTAKKTYNIIKQNTETRPVSEWTDEEIHNRVVNEGWWVRPKGYDYYYRISQFTFTESGEDYCTIGGNYFSMLDLRIAEIVKEIPYEE